MAHKEKRWSVGRIAEITGLTVRTLQHYDHIGLLPPSGRTEGGRRFYTQSDLLKLEQIVFYRSVGFPLAQIKAKVIEAPSLKALEQILGEHLGMLLAKMDALHMALSVLNASTEVIRAGHYPPWESLVHLIRMVDGSSLNDWKQFSFEPAFYQAMADKEMTITGAMGMYHTLRELMVEAATLGKVEIAPESLPAQSLAKRWWAMILTMTHADASAVSALSAVDHARDTWPEADRALFEEAEPFLEAALAAYIEQNGIEVPDALLRGDPA